MQDGQNLFFPDEAFLGQDWDVDETSQTLRAMSAVEDFVIVGIHSDDRMRDYTEPGYEAVRPVARRGDRARSASDGCASATIGATARSGALRSAAWCPSTPSGSIPSVFGTAVCMSSTFSHRDNLIDRVLDEPARDVGFYLDSGWPGDNYEVTMAMAMALVSRGWRYGHNLLHLCFPHAEHDEAAWGMRLHLPMQFLNGAVARASRIGAPVLGA